MHFLIQYTQLYTGTVYSGENVRANPSIDYSFRLSSEPERAQRLHGAPHIYVHARVTRRR